MKSIKIQKSNAAHIVDALREINGKAFDHAFTEYSEIVALATAAEAATLQAVGAKCRAAGACTVATSGKKVASSYKYTRSATEVRLERRAGGWYLVDAKPVAVWARGGHDPKLSLSAEQAAQAAAHGASKYSVAA